MRKLAVALLFIMAGCSSQPEPQIIRDSYVAADGLLRVHVFEVSNLDGSAFYDLGEPVVAVRIERLDEDSCMTTPIDTWAGRMRISIEPCQRVAADYDLDNFTKTRVAVTSAIKDSMRYIYVTYTPLGKRFMENPKVREEVKRLIESGR